MHHYTVHTTNAKSYVVLLQVHCVKCVTYIATFDGMVTDLKKKQKRIKVMLHGSCVREGIFKRGHND